MSLVGANRMNQVRETSPAAGRFVRTPLAVRPAHSPARGRGVGWSASMLGTSLVFGPVMPFWPRLADIAISLQQPPSPSESQAAAADWSMVMTDFQSAIDSAPELTGDGTW